MFDHPLVEGGRDDTMILQWFWCQRPFRQIYSISLLVLSEERNTEDYTENTNKLYCQRTLLLIIINPKIIYPIKKKKKKKKEKKRNHLTGESRSSCYTRVTLLNIYTINKWWEMNSYIAWKSFHLFYPIGYVTWENTIRQMSVNFFFTFVYELLCINYYYNRERHLNYRSTIFSFHVPFSYFKR